MSAPMHRPELMARVPEPVYNELLRAIVRETGTDDPDVLALAFLGPLLLAPPYGDYIGDECPWAYFGHDGVWLRCTEPDDEPGHTRHYDENHGGCGWEENDVRAVDLRKWK